MCNYGVAAVSDSLLKIVTMMWVMVATVTKRGGVIALYRN